MENKKVFLLCLGAFEMPSGRIAYYRSDYEICPSWSPPGKLVRCTLKAGVCVVVGAGQRAECSEYLMYSVPDE